MNDRILLCIATMLRASIASSMFFHEPSSVTFQSGHSDFGFSIGYRIKERELVVGSPHDGDDHVGKVYRCPIDQDPKNQACDDLHIDVKNLANDYNTTDINQDFCLGATIAVTSTYFVTCAPLWTTVNVKNNEDEKLHSGSYGTCFVYRDSAQRFNGTLEQSKAEDDGHNYVHIYGGVGWSSLVDEANEVLLIAKPFDRGDIQYVNSKALEANPKQGFKSLLYSDRTKTNIGYAMAAGKFFSDYYSNSTVYAFSMKDEKDLWQVQFLYKDNSGILNRVKKNESENFALTISGTTDVLGDMFGAAMVSADLDHDGVTDLLIGAPTHTKPGQCETGALYIFKGGEKISFKERMVKLVSDGERSRFGSAIVTADLDGDLLPEIIVSAPYEDSGTGALYIFSGYQLKKHSKNYTTKTELLLKDMTKLPGVQRITSTKFRSFGFSLSVVRDINDNGCDEIAVGSPQSSRVILFRCVPSVKATVNVTRLSEVKISDSKFSVRVCVNINYRMEQKNISSQFRVISKVFGKGATIPNDTFEVHLSPNHTESYCDDVIVNLREGEAGSYRFAANLEYMDENLYERKEFNNQWARLSVDSELTKSIVFQRACAEDNCTPDLHMDILWDGSKEPGVLYVNEKIERNVTLVIRNDGSSVAYDANVRLKITGGKERIKCNPLFGQGEYDCPIPVILKKDSTYNITFVVGIEQARNMSGSVLIAAELFNGFADSEFKPKKKTLDVKYIFGLRNVFILESSHNLTVTDTQIQNRTNPLLIDTHEYKIVNNGTLEWEDVSAIINVPSRPYFESTHILINEVEKGCVKKNTSTNGSVDVISFICSGMKLYDVPVTISVRNEICLGKIMAHLVDGNLKIESNIEVRMASSNDAFQFPHKTQTTFINVVKETSIGNNKNAIMIIVIVISIIILLLIALILYKIGFFKRKEKTRLDSFKASIKQKDRAEDKPSSSGGEELKQDSIDDSSMEDFEIEVIDDSAFEPINMTTDDEANLIVEDTHEPRRSQSSIKKAPSIKHRKTSNQDPLKNHSTDDEANFILEDTRKPRTSLCSIKKAPSIKLSKTNNQDPIKDQTIADDAPLVVKDKDFPDIGSNNDHETTKM